jgi:signal transduction histidine kinase
MDLHDGIIQSIYAVGLTLESSRLALADNPQETDQLLSLAIEGLNDAIRDIRNFILDLRPQRFAGDLGEALGRLQREFQVNTSVPVSLSAPPRVIKGLPAAVSRAIFLTAQEALANIARHAKASNVTVTLERIGSDARMTIADDGRGFDTEARAQTTGHGLANMRTRAEDLHGSFELEAVPGRGTTIRMTLPCARKT